MSQHLQILSFTINLQVLQNTNKIPLTFLDPTDSFYLVKHHHAHIHAGEGEICEPEHRSEGQRSL